MCQGNSCCSGGSCGCQAKSCGCNKSQCGCQKSSCGSSGEKSCNMADKFLELADQAWMEVLKEKIKENIKANAKNMDDLARLISEANHEKWQKKIESKKCCGGFEERLKSFFDQSCQSCQTKPKNNH